MRSKAHFSTLAEVPRAERRRYFKLLRKHYGEDVACAEDDLDARYQARFERLRHAHNARIATEPTGPLEAHSRPERVLCLLTQRCDRSCAHCWMFCSPRAQARLTDDALGRVLGSTPELQPRSITLSGGEVFLDDRVFHILQHHPVHCVYTNGFWGEPTTRCQEVIRRLRDAISRNPAIEVSRFTLIVSLDSLHVGRSSTSIEAVANLITGLYHELPAVAIRLSTALRSKPDPSIETLAQVLRDRGVRWQKRDATDQHSPVRSEPVSYGHGANPSKLAWVDAFSVAPVGRGLFLRDWGSEVGVRPDSVRTGGASGARAGTTPQRIRYRYVIGPDGRVAPYEMLFAPPVPFCVGNIATEGWQAIIHRARRDPIVVMTWMEGVEAIVALAQDQFPELTERLRGMYTVTQEQLYVLLLSPMRRLFLNAVLQRACVDRGYLRLPANVEYPRALALRPHSPAMVEHAVRQVYGL